MITVHLLVRYFVLVFAVVVFLHVWSTGYIQDEYYVTVPSLKGNVELCKDISWLWLCLSNGSWSLRDGVTQDDLRRRREIDASILEYLDWPGILFRSDGRCGRSFKVPGSSLPSLCDEYSDKPCCNEVTGLCGITAEHCECKTCRDFRRYVTAELAEWIPYSATCSIEEFSKASACEFLQKHVTNIVFVGDSLVRHFFAAFAILVTGDVMRGAQNIKLKPESLEQLENCEGEYQFIDRGKYNCHGTIAHSWEELNRSQVCDGKGTFRMSLVEAYSLPFVDQAVATAQNLLGKKGSIMVIGVGLHMSTNHREVIDKYLTPILNVTEKDKSGWPLLTWVTIPAAQNYLKSSVDEHERPIKAFNSRMKTFCHQHNIQVLDMTDITDGIQSYDGRHFGFGGNMAKAQLLMNFLKLRVDTCGHIHSR